MSGVLTLKIGEMIFNKTFDTLSGGFISKIEDKIKLKNLQEKYHIAVTEFDGKFEDSSLDTRVFYDFMNKDKDVEEYFATLFWKGGYVGDIEKIDSLIQKSMEVINHDRKKRGISNFSDKEILYDYFSEIKIKLKELRRTFIGFDKGLLAATIVDDVVGGVEKLLVASKESSLNLDKENKFPKIGVRTYSLGTDKMESECSNILDLSDFFEGKAIKNETMWNSEILPRIKNFVDNEIESSILQTLELHTVQSVAFTVGYFAHLKSNKNLLPIQSQVIWETDDFANYKDKELTSSYIDNNSDEVIIAIDLMDVNFDKELTECYSGELSDILSIKPEKPQRMYVENGHHSMKLVYEIDAILQSLPIHVKRKRWKFAITGPNAFIFMLGRQATQYGKITLLHYDPEEFIYTDSIVLK